MPPKTKKQVKEAEIRKITKAIEENPTGIVTPRMVTILEKNVISKTELLRILNILRIEKPKPNTTRDAILNGLRIAGMRDVQNAKQMNTPVEDMSENEKEDAIAMYWEDEQTLNNDDIKRLLQLGIKQDGLSKLAREEFQNVKLPKDVNWDKKSIRAYLSQMVVHRDFLIEEEGKGVTIQKASDSFINSQKILPPKGPLLEFKEDDEDVAKQAIIEEDRVAEADRVAREEEKEEEKEADKVAREEANRVAREEADRVAEAEFKRQEERKNMTPEEVKAEADGITASVAEDVKRGQNLFKRVVVRPPAPDSAMRSTETDTSEFDSIGYSINNADSASEISKIIPTVKQQADSNKRIALNNVVTSSLWRAFDSTMNQDLVLRHRIINGGILNNGTVANRRKKKAPLPRRKPTQLRNVLYNRNFYIPRDPPLSTKLTGLNSRELNTWDNPKYNPQLAPWRSPPVV